MLRLQRHAVLTLLGVVIGFLALYWIDPLTSGGRTFLVSLVVLIINVVGGLLWRSTSPE